MEFGVSARGRDGSGRKVPTQGRDDSSQFPISSFLIPALVHSPSSQRLASRSVLQSLRPSGRLVVTFSLWPRARYGGAPDRWLQQSSTQKLQTQARSHQRRRDQQRQSPEPTSDPRRGRATLSRRRHWARACCQPGNPRRSSRRPNSRAPSRLCQT